MKKKSQKEPVQQILGVTTEQTVVEYGAQAYKTYGAKVVEQRAIPCIYDGLKPVQRMALWALYKLNLHHNTGFRKAARVVGEVIGKYHPHGDKAAYDAMVLLAGTKNSQGTAWDTRNCTTPLLEGYGNWGDITSEAAAYRYTEVRLSKFSDMILLDPDYIAVMDTIPNFDDSEQVPVVLPAKLPIMLVLGSTSIGFGIAASCPSFALAGIIKLSKLALGGKAINSKLCLKYLKFEYPYGGECVSPPEDIVAVFKGKGSVYFEPSYVTDDNKKIITLTSVCPGLMSKNSISNLLGKCAALSQVASVDDETGKEGIRYVIQAKKTVSATEFQELVVKILDLAARSERCDIGITFRDTQGQATFKRSSVPEIFNIWSKWRIELEIKVLNRLIRLEEEKLKRQELILLAVNNLDVIIKALKVTKDTETVTIAGEKKEIDASAAFLMKNLKLSLDDAEFILEMRVRQLRAMNKDRINQTIAKIKAELKQLKEDLKQPDKRAIRELNKLEDNLF